jgi:hypothetical protein
MKNLGDSSILYELTPEERARVEQIILVVLQEIRYDLDLNKILGSPEHERVVKAINWYLDGLSQVTREIFLEIGQRRTDGATEITVDAIPVGEGDSILH